MGRTDRQQTDGWTTCKYHASSHNIVTSATSFSAQDAFTSPYLYKLHLCSKLSSGKNKGAESVVFVFLQFSSFKKSVKCNWIVL